MNPSKGLKQQHIADIITSNDSKTPIAAVENIAVGISAAYIFLDACSVLIIISAEAVVLAELYEQLNYTLSTRFCQIYYASYNISKEYY